MSSDDAADQPGTATLEAARAHARAQAEAAASTGVTIPSTAAVELPNGVDAASVVWDETIPIGGYAARRLPRDTVLRITDLDGDACVQLLVFRAERTAERLNVADTVKVQWQAYLGPGAVLLSDMGRVLMTMVDDTSGRHDCFCSGSNLAGNAAHYGDGGVSGPSPASRELQVVAGAKHGLERRDLPPAINLFAGVRVADDGGLVLAADPVAGAFVELRAEMDVIVLLTNTPHVLDPRDEYAGTTARCTAWHAGRDEPDRLRTATPERERAFQNTDELLAGGAR